MDMRSTNVEYGQVAALHSVAERIGLVDVINELAPKRLGIPPGELVEILAINRVVGPRAKVNIPLWYQLTYLPELLGVSLPLDSGYQTLTRCYDYLTESVQMDIEMELAGRVRDAYHLTDSTYLYDTTSTFVEGVGDADILQYGYSKDSRPDQKQLNYALVVTREWNVPMFHLAFPGNRNDATTVKQTMDMFHDRLGLKGCMVVDRGMVTAANVKEIVDERELDLVAGMRLNPKLKKMVRKIKLGEYDDSFELKKETIHPNELEISIADRPRRCLLYFSEEKAERDAKSRERLREKVANEMGSFRKKASRKGRGRTVTTERLRKQIDRYLSDKKAEKFVTYHFTGGRDGRHLKWEWNEDALNDAKKMDGKYMLITTLPDAPEEILTIYRSRNGVERAFRITKENIRIRPIFNRKDEHIKAHLFICFIAYLLISLLEMQLRQKGLQITAIKALRQLSTQRVDVKRTIESEAGEDILERLGIDSPIQ